MTSSFPKGLVTNCGIDRSRKGNQPRRFSRSVNFVVALTEIKIDTSALAGFHKFSLSRSNWNLKMLVFDEGAKAEDSVKNPRSKATNNKLNPLVVRAESNLGDHGGNK